MIDSQQFLVAFLGLLGDVVSEMQRITAVEGPPGPQGPPGPIGPPGAGFPGVFVQKTVDESVVSSAVLQNDDQLFFAVSPNEKWTFFFYLVYESGTTPDIKVAVIGPALASVVWSAHPQWAAGNGFQVPDAQSEVTTLVLGAAGPGTRQVALLVGLIVNDGNAGACRLQWAQNTANATPAIVHASSWLMANRVSP